MFTVLMFTVPTFFPNGDPFIQNWVYFSRKSYYILENHITQKYIIYLKTHNSDYSVFVQRFLGIL